MGKDKDSERKKITYIAARFPLVNIKNNNNTYLGINVDKVG